MPAEPASLFPTLVLADERICERLSDLIPFDHHDASEAHPDEHTVFIRDSSAADAEIPKLKTCVSNQNAYLRDEVRSVT